MIIVRKIAHAVSFLIFLIFAYVSTAGAQGVDSPPENKSKLKQLFLLIGQSNMAGRGKLDSLHQVVNNHLYKLDRTQKWVPATDPLHFDKSVAGVGPGLAFAQELAMLDSTIEIGLVPCAVGGTSISQWQRGGYDSVTNTHPYDDAVKRIRIALNDGTLKGILWHQGEGDSHHNRYEKYENRFDSLYRHLGEDLGVDIDTIPFLVGELGPFYVARRGRNQGHEIDSVLHRIATKHLNMRCVSAEGLTHRGDTLHFDAMSAREFGKRYARAYLDLLSKIPGD